MTNINSISLKCLLLAFLMLLGAGMVQAQNKNKESRKTEIKNLVDSRNFTFKAQSVTPMGGGFWQLTSDYTLSVSGNTVQADLPYFGRAFSATMHPSEAGIQFTSTDFNYKAEKRKKGWHILIEPKDHRDVRQLILNVAESGSATLQVTSLNRQYISYNGYIVAKK